ncbi:vasculin-like [Heterocephalus glaber]|uniref:Vasculin n=1 Tax=Heterocephalus glaber TaxID=10181 RepID=A0AAX6REU3_HETGA|nr:vasculin-like [Heterocephalus glaber]
MLVIKKGNTKDLQLSGFPVVGNLQLQSVKNGTGPSVYKGLVPKPAAPPTEPIQCKSQTKENKAGTSFPHESAYSVGNFSAFKSAAKNFSPSTNSVKECNHSNYSLPVDKLNQQPRLTKLTQMRTAKKCEFLKALKRDRVEEHEDESHAGSEKDEDSFNLHNSNSTHQERDINRNFAENEIPQENDNASVISQQII